MTTRKEAAKEMEHMRQTFIDLRTIPQLQKKENKLIIESYDMAIASLKSWDNVIKKIKTKAKQIDNPDTVNGLLGALNIINDAIGGVFE